MKTERALAAVFIDFENEYYFLKNDAGTGAHAEDYSVDLLRKLKQFVQETYDEHAISLDAYADFERIEDNAQSALYLLGIETHNVLGTDHKNAADMKLCIDALDVLYTREEIRTFVVVAGDRDYIPLIRHLKKHGRTVRVAGFRQAVSGDLLANVGDEFFIDVGKFVRHSPPKPAASPAPAAAGSGAAPAVAVGFAPEPHNVEGLAREALMLLFKYFAGKREVWVTPFLHKLRSDMPQLQEHERKQIISGLHDSGVVRVEKRTGEPHDYSVMVVNWNHPDVRAINPG